MKAETIAKFVAACQSAQVRILEQHKPCSLDISTSFFGNLLGTYPRAELYGCSVSFRWNGNTLYQQVTDEEELKLAEELLSKADTIINNL